MRTSWMLIIGSLLVLLLASFLLAEEARQVKCAGNVVDTQGKPVSGAQVKLYLIHHEQRTYTAEFKAGTEVTTSDDGAFNFSSTTDASRGSSLAVVICKAEGTSLGWYIWSLRDDAETTIELAEAANLEGIVVDSNGAPLEGAKVILAYMVREDRNGQRQSIPGGWGLDMLSVETNGEGKFAFEDLPVDATVELQVGKEGFGTALTFDPETFRRDQLSHAPGEDSVKMTLAPGGRIKGKVVKKGTDEGIPGIKLLARRGRSGWLANEERPVSSEDGSFTIGNLKQGRYTLMLVSQSGQTAEWVGEYVEVDVNDGQTTGGVKVEVSKGAFIEVTVTTEDGKPVDEARVNFISSNDSQNFSGVTDANGVAKVRVTPGEYRRHAYKSGYTPVSPEEMVTAEEGQTLKEQVHLRGMPKVTGVVTDPEGKPVGGASVGIMPMGRPLARTDAEGKYEAQWDPRMFGGNAPTMHLVVRHFERNLGKVVPVFEDTMQMDIRLEPGVVACGIVTDANDKPIENAKITLRLSVSGYSSPISDSQECRSGTEGTFEVKAIPIEHKYTVNVSADGYGTNDSGFDTADANEGRIDVGQLKLALANMSVSGVVVGSDETPIEGAQVMGYGTGQPHVRATTDKEGKFVLEGVCAGKIELNAHVSGGAYRYGRAVAEGGDTDVWVAMRDPSGQSAPREPASLVGRQLPDMKGLGVESLPDANGKMLLIAFWDMGQRPSRHCVTQLAKMADELAREGVVTAVVQASEADKEALRNWIQQYKMPFASGMLGEDAEKVRFTWGVKSLPWLILTDTQHAVKANGFALGELSAKIDEIKQ